MSFESGAACGEVQGISEHVGLTSSRIQQPSETCSRFYGANDPQLHFVCCVSSPANGFSLLLNECGLSKTCTSVDDISIASLYRLIDNDNNTYVFLFYELRRISTNCF